jgi:hypothetical protein
VRVRGAVVSGEPRPTGVQPSHGSDHTPPAAPATPPLAGPGIMAPGRADHKIINLVRPEAGPAPGQNELRANAGRGLEWSALSTVS